jgi:lipoprotein-anchoring transpeptidase ErfK/SrfK
MHETTILPILWMAIATAAGGQKGGTDVACTSHRRIVVSIADRKLALIDQEHIVRIYSIAVGAPRTPSPSGSHTIKNRIPNPTYYSPRKAVGPGKANPLGTRWIGLSLRSYGIHGTNAPRSIGRAASHGCIRMRNRDVEDLFGRVEVGDVVELYEERTDQVGRIFASATGTVVME